MLDLQPHPDGEQHGLRGQQLPAARGQVRRVTVSSSGILLIDIYLILQNILIFIDILNKQ